VDPRAPKTFLQNSIDQFNRGWLQMYGPRATRPTVPTAHTRAPDNVNPISKDPPVGQPLGADGGDQSTGQNGGGGFLQWLQSFFSGLGGQQSQNGAPTNLTGQGGALAGNPTMSMVGPAGPGQGDNWGVNPSATPDAVTAAQNPAGTGATTGSGSGMLGGMGGGGGGGMGGSILSGLGSAVSNSGKNQPTFTFTQPQTNQAKPAYFVAPSLAPNRNTSY
jgi:hypothetical protein